MNALTRLKRGACRRGIWFVIGFVFLVPVAGAQENPFAGGWVLDQAASHIAFQTIKNSSKLETSEFANFSGDVDEQGNGALSIQLDSVDTKVDLRNVRMRFLLFETFRFPEAKVAVSVDPDSIQDLDKLGRIEMPLEFELDLHGIKKKLSIDTVVTVLKDGQVSVASVEPLAIETSLFGLDVGIKKLENAAKVSIVPMGAVSFNLVFTRGVAAQQLSLEQDTSEQQATAQTVALETQGEFSFEECIGRFEVISQTGAIQFRIASARLNPQSKHVLTTLIDVIDRCPTLNVLIAGHTDSVGSESENQILSEVRAQAVQEYLIENAINPQRVRAIGFGESRPIASNDSDWNRQRNRRIEIAVDDS